MFKLKGLLTCLLFLGFIGTSRSAPLDSAETVYINGLPCNGACQSYMAWSDRVRRTAPVAAQPTPLRPIKRSLTANTQRKTRIGKVNPNRGGVPTRVAEKAARKVSPANIVAAQSADSGEAKSSRPEEVKDSSPTANPTTDSKNGPALDQAATSPVAEDLTTGTAGRAPEQRPESNANSAAPEEAIPPSDAKMGALSSPTHADQQVAVLLAREDFKSVSDLADKVVAIDDLQSDVIPLVRTAITAAGATNVQLSEGGETKPAIIRLLRGDVPAAIVTVASPDDAENWATPIPGFKIFRIPLLPPLDKSKGG